MDVFGHDWLDEFPLERGGVYLNHGTVGVTPLAVMRERIAILEAIERHPARFVLRELMRLDASTAATPSDGTPRLREAAAKVAGFLGCAADGLVFVDNATSGICAVLRSVPLAADDEILVPDLAYGGVARAAAFIARERGATVTTCALPFPASTAEGVLAALEAAITPRTRIALLDHVTSESALVMPLAETAATAQQLSAGDTTARAPTDGPVEVADVGRALNRLADRIDELIAEERETVADLSHRLRTPLTALRLDAEALDEPAEAERIGGHVSALERMLTAVIHAARRPQREGRIPASDATQVVSERVAFWSALTEDQDRLASLAVPTQPLPVRAGAEDLAAAVDALLENVIAHTPEGVAYSVTLSETERGARLVVSDGGPGLPSDAPVRGRSDRGSSGLGLDIARRCAVASGGSMTLGVGPTGGAAITLEFGRP